MSSTEYFFVKYEVGMIFCQVRSRNDSSSFHLPLSAFVFTASSLYKCRECFLRWFGSAVTCLTRKPFISRGCGADPQQGARSPPYLSPSFTCYYNINIVYLVQGHWSTKFIFWYHYILYLLFQYFNLSTIKLICGQLELLICTLLLIYN